MIKAIFFDIDGTLLSYRTHQVLQGTIAAFESLRHNGIKTFISSGRPMVLIPQMPVAFDGYVTVNGGYCLADNKVVFRNAINPDDCHRWLDYVLQHNLTTMCFTANDMCINRIDPTTEKLRNQLGFQMPPILSVDEMRGRETYQFIAVQPAEKDSEVLESLSHCRMPRWHPAFTDLIPDNSSKAVGMQHILDHFGIDRQETMAFGDGANDIEMLDFAGFSVAMGNADPKVKQHADLITEDADSEGIYNALKHTGLI